MLRVTPMTVQCKTNHLVPDCSTGGDSTSGGSFDGSLIDRLQLGTNFTHAQPFVIGGGLSNTSTDGIKRVILDVLLSHGDSSGGGDLAEVDTGLRVAQQANFNSVVTTVEKTWSTDTLRFSHFSRPYSLLGVKRFITASAIVERAGVTTATAEGNLVRVALGVNLLQAGEEPVSHLGRIPAPNDVVFTTATNT